MGPLTWKAIHRSTMLVSAAGAYGRVDFAFSNGRQEGHLALIETACFPVTFARRRIRAALLLLAVVAASAGAPERASAAPAPRPWRSVSAPAAVLTLADHVMQPDLPETGEGGEEDTTDLPELRERDAPPASQPTFTPPGTGPGFSIPDTSRSRSDSVLTFPGGAAGFDSMGSAIGKSSGGTAAPPGAKPRRGILGLHPTALLVSLVALHIFVVTVAGK